MDSSNGCHIAARGRASFFGRIRRNQRGFSLAELMVTLGVGAVLFGIGIPSYRMLTMNSIQVSSANELLGSFHFARDLAITRNARVTVCPSSVGTNCEAVQWNEGWIVFLDQDGDRVVDPGETVERVVDDFGELTFSTSEFSTFLIYRPNGRVMVNGVQENMGEFTLCDARGASHARAIVVDVSGRPRVSKYQADGSMPVCS